MREGLLALALGACLQVTASLMEADVAAVCGPRGRTTPGAPWYAVALCAGRVTLGGRRKGVTRPRMRATSGGGEVSVPAHELFRRSEILGRMAMGKMLGGLSSRQNTLGLKPVGENVERTASATSRSADIGTFSSAPARAPALIMWSGPRNCRDHNYRDHNYRDHATIGTTQLEWEGSS